MSIDPRAVGLGAVIALGVVVPPLLVYQALALTDVIGDESNLAFVFYVVLMAGFGLGGFVAASKRPDMPLAHGALAALTAFVTVQLIAAIVVLVRGDGLSVLSIAFNAMLASALGVLGGLIATRRGAAATS